MSFYWAGFIFWALIFIAVLLFIYGIWKKSWQSFIISGMALVLPMLYFGCAENAFKLLMFVPLIPFSLAYIIRKNVKKI